MTDLAVIIVNWNTRVLTLGTLRTLFEDLHHHSTLASAVYVVDNASTDGSVEAIRRDFPAVRLITNTENRGFGAANNIALRALGFGSEKAGTENLPRAVYLLNSDTLTQPGATQTLFNALFTLPEAGVVGARLTYGDGSFQHSAFAFPGLSQLWIDLLPYPPPLYNSRLNGRYPLAWYSGSEAFAVGHTLGATMMLKAEVIQQTGMFDEQFFMYAEEVDWSWRIQKAGWKIYCVPQAHVVHLGGQSAKQAQPESIIYLWESRLRLFKKHYPPLKRWMAHRLVVLGIARKVRQTQEAYARRQISAKEREALIDAYRQVMTLRG